MFLGHFLFALAIALILALIFGAGFGRHRWGADLLIFFLLLFLFTWAGGLWITPFGPAFWGVPFFSFLLVGLLFALLLAAVIPAAGEIPARGSAAEKVREGEKSAAIAINLFLWLLIAGLIIAIIAGYL